MNKVWTSLVLICCCVGTLSAEEVTIDANRDAGYFDLGPDRNLGAHVHVPVGTANNARINRSVFDFDILGNVPAGETINSVTFVFEVTVQGGVQGQAAADFDIHVVTTAWDEGTGTMNVGQDTFDGASWNSATATTMWTTPGGDFSPTISGSVNVNGAATYMISSPQLVTDIQNIVDGTTTNLGFLMKANVEGLPEVFGSAARVTSREGGTPAQLIIDFGDATVLLGDVNLDGMVNLLDVAPFVDRISTGTFQLEADINEDGNVNLLDVAPFIDLLSGG